jgi:hypothetical protein
MHAMLVQMDFSVSKIQTMLGVIFALTVHVELVIEMEMLAVNHNRKKNRRTVLATKTSKINSMNAICKMTFFHFSPRVD